MKSGVKIVLTSWVEWNLCSEPPIYIPILVHLISRIILESRKILEFQYWSALLNTAYISSLSHKKANGQQRGKVATMWQKGHKKAIEVQKDHKKTNVLKNYNTQIKGTLMFSKSYHLWAFGEKIFEFLSDLRFMCRVTPIYTHFSPSNFQDNPGSRKILEFQYWSALLNPAVTYATAENQGSLFWITCKRLKLLRKGSHLQVIQNSAPSVFWCVNVTSEYCLHKILK